MESREDRLQQRLRGAHSRQVEDVDFGLVFAPPATVVSPLPQPEAHTTPLALPAQLSTGIPSANATPADASSGLSSLKSVHNANTSAKLRKLGRNPPLPSRSTRSSQKPPRPDVYTLVDDTELASAEPANVSGEALIRESTIKPNIIPDTIESRGTTPVRTVEEVTESPLDAPGSGRRLRTIEKVALTSSRLRLLQEDSVVGQDTDGTTPIPAQRKRKRSETPVREASPDLSQGLFVDADDINNAGVDELSPEQPTFRSERSKRSAPEPSPESEVDEEAQAEAIDDKQAAILLRNNTRRRSLRIFSTSSHKLAHPVSPVAKKRKGKHRVNSSPAQQRQPKANSKSRKKLPRDQFERYGSPIPVTVHRLVGSTSIVYDEDDPDASILNAKIPRPKRGDPNAVDVLSQVCQEIVTSTLESLEDAGNRSEDPAIRREFKTKYDGVEAYGRELQTRLLEHAINLDNGDSLQRRLRDQQKRKLNLREQISRIRAEREQVALSIDKVRIRHENETRKALSRDDLNNTVHDIEMAIEVGKTSKNADQHEKVGTELLLKRIASQVSNKSDSGGLLRKLKEANAFFERAALVLEGRTI